MWPSVPNQLQDEESSSPLRLLQGMPQVVRQQAHRDQVQGSKEVAPAAVHRLPHVRLQEEHAPPYGEGPQDPELVPEPAPWPKDRCEWPLID